MKFSHNWLQTYFEKPLPKPEKLAELLTMHIFEVEGIEEIKNANGEISDHVLDVKILPDRACYAYGHANLAREINAFTDAGFKNKEYPSPKADEISAPLDQQMPKSNIADDNNVHIFTKRLISGIDAQSMASPQWLKDALEAVGQRTISPIVDLTNYVMLDIAQPMHAFDADKLVGDVDIRFANDGEKIILLDGREVTLDSSVMVISDAEGALDIMGIKGGKKAEVDQNTRNIIITAGSYNASYIRKTAQKVGIKNDSTKRYENNISPQWTLLAQDEFYSLLKKECPQIQVSKLFVVGKGIDPDALTPQIKITTDFVSQKIGLDVSADEILNILKSLEITTQKNGDEIIVTVPFYRRDLLISEDIIEEVARLKGINSMPEVVPKADIAVPMLPSFFYSNITRNILLGFGFSEIYTHTLIDKGDIALANPLTSERSHLRNNLSHGMKQALCFNVQNIDLLGGNNLVAEDVRIFDIGHVFNNKKETWSLVIGVASRVSKKARENNKKTLQTAMQEVAKSLGLPMEGVECLETNENQTITEGETEAQGGAVPVSYCIAEINFESVLTSLPTPEEFKSNSDNAKVCGDASISELVDMTSAKRFKRFSPYPYIVRDIAVFIPGPTGRAEELRELIREANGSIIVRIRQFDEFEKKNKETGEVEKTSYGFRMVFQAGDRTLTDAEVQGVMDQILKKIGEKEGWEVR